MRDVIDWRWLTDESRFSVTVERDGARVELAVDREPGEPLGVVFEFPVFDGIRECVNACAFCFVAQLPAGLRSALYVRDDDFRLSFLSGNFVTLTNLDDEDVTRICEQRLSPLQVSVHAVDPDVRRRLLCPTRDDGALAVLDRLLASGIEVHAQVVLVPDVNDGRVLVRTLEWLAERPGVLSVGLVPMGYTAHQRRWTRSYAADGAATILSVATGFQSRMRAERGVGWVYAADELYLLARHELPTWSEYDGFPQYENGIGMVRAFADELAASETADAPATLVTGELFAPVLQQLVIQAGLGSADVLGVANRTFGGNVAVAGLLTGADITSAIAAHSAAAGAPSSPYLIPDVVVNSDGLLLDDIAAADLGEMAGADVRLVGSDAGSLAGALTQLSGRRSPWHSRSSR